jgi:16S rRNA (cytosine967-C5)-methyltransferase
MNLRAAASRVIYQVVIDKRSLVDCLTDVLLKFKDPRDRGFLQALCYGVCRSYFYLHAVLDLLLQKPLKAKDQDIYCLLLVGIYQLNEMRVPDHAAVKETVAATQDLNKVWAKELVNAVLRNFVRQKVTLDKKIAEDLVAFYSHPLWFIQAIQKNYPDEWQTILIANNQHPPLALRVNPTAISRTDYLEKLRAQGIQAQIIPETKSGIVLEQPLDVQQLPGFAEGEVSVQDGAAQLAAELLELAPGQRVLDACAAPGGKTTHLLECEPTLELLAIDQDESRLQLVRENLQRLHLSATCLCADVGTVARGWDGRLFDRILLDAPCSATGIIRRHPDIKLLRTAEDILKLSKQQSRLLNAVWDLLKPGGLLLYVTCSILEEENASVIQRFLQQHPEAKEEKITAAWGKECSVGKQILPGMHEMDGFYFARLRR